MSDVGESVPRRRAGNRRLLIAVGFLAVLLVGILFGRQLLALLPPPASVDGRSPVPSCGVEQAGLGGPWNVPARTCFWSAYLNGQPAEFTSTRPTIEGAPITTIYRVLGPGQVEIIIDTRQDPYSNRGWAHLLCPRLIAQEGQPQPDFGWGDDCVGLPID